MPRTSSSSHRSPVKSFPVYTAPKALPTPAPAPYIPPQSSVQTVQMQAPGVWDSVKQGFGWGVGTSIARSFFGPSESKSSTSSNPTSTPLTQQNPRCQEHENAFQTCIKTAPHDIQTCQAQLDSWNACLKK